jgi:3-hydroxybutyrate dehydrogenase
MSLEGKAALITGSTSGIGLGIAEEMAKAGCNIVLNGFGEHAAIKTLQERIFLNYGVRVRYIEADVSNPEECRALMNQTLAEYGGLDILVNNAGIQHVSPVESFATERWDAVLATNLSSAFYLTAAAIPAMRSKGYGRIINIASVHGLVGSVNKSAYVASKHGLIGLTKVVALETARYGITCNAICPGWVLTPIVEAQIRQRMEQEGTDRQVAERRLLEETQPSGVFSRPCDIGAFAVFLCSESAGNITGASLPIDGVWTAR